MKSISRREFISTTALAAIGSAAVLRRTRSAAAEAPRRKMTIDLVCGSIGVSANQRDAIEMAARHGFESVGADGGFLASLPAQELAELRSTMQAKGLVFGAAGLSVEFRQDQERFETGMKGLPGIAAGLKRAGVRRVSTWLTPCSRQITYLENFRTHAKRLREVAKVFKDSDIRLGLEYVGPKTSWSSQKFPFIHTMAEMKELIAEIGTGNVGFLLDSWHWWHAGESAVDIRSLKAEDVVAVDLNDAPASSIKDQMPDNRRELPAATGVIPVDVFLRSLHEIDYDGPVRVEPFNQKVNSMENDEACAAAAAALKKAFAQAGL